MGCSYKHLLHSFPFAGLNNISLSVKRCLLRTKVTYYDTRPLTAVCAWKPIGVPCSVSRLRHSQRCGAPREEIGQCEVELRLRRGTSRVIDAPTDQPRLFQVHPSQDRSGLPRANVYRPGAPRRKTSFRQFSPVASSAELDATSADSSPRAWTLRSQACGSTQGASLRVLFLCCHARCLTLRAFHQTHYEEAPKCAVSTRAGFRAICHEPTKNPGTGTGTGIAPVWRPATCRSAEIDSRHTGFFVIAAPCIWSDLGSGSRLSLLLPTTLQLLLDRLLSLRLQLPHIGTASTLAPSLCSELVLGNLSSGKCDLHSSLLDCVF